MSTGSVLGSSGARGLAFFAKSLKAGDTSEASDSVNFGLGALKACVGELFVEEAAAENIPKVLTANTNTTTITKNFLFIIKILFYADVYEKFVV
jgi:hypothetical protein